MEAGNRCFDQRVPEELNRVWILRKVLNPLSVVESMELLLDKLKATESNGNFLDSMTRG